MDLVEWGLGVICLADDMLVEVLKIDSPSGFSEFLEHTSVLWHQMTGVPIGTDSITPS